MGRGAATMYAASLADADCIVFEGSNMAENHPCAFTWAMKAKLKGATLIHVDPRFTRTSAVSNVYAPIRAGSDIAFLGGLINYVINSDRWNNDPFFKEFVVNYTNAPTIINAEFKDTEDLDGVFSGLMEYKGDPLNGFLAVYDNATWQYARGEASEGGRAAATAQSGEQPVQSGGQGEQGQQPPKGPPFDPLVRSLLKPPAQRDETLQDPRTVFQILKRHYSRYTPEMVERVTGCPQETFLKVAETILENSGADRTTSFCYAVAWTQHSMGPQMISCCATLQLLLGNMGRPGGGIQALRGHATIQGCTDIPTLYHSVCGYMAAPSALKKHDTLADYLATETLPTGYWANTPKFFVSYLKSMFGDAATPENDFGYDWHPKISGDHSHMPMMVAMADGKVKGMFCMGQNPATSLNGSLQRKALGKLEWLVVKDNFEHETASFWYNAPEIRSGEVRPEDIQTEVFLFPSAQVAEIEGSFTNTQRWVQWHEKAADPPADARSDAWFTHQLAKRLKAMYADSTEPRDEGFKNLLWEFDYDEGEYPENTKIQGEPDIHKVLKEINGYQTDNPSEHLKSFADMKDDGSTTGSTWIYTGIFPSPDKNRAASRQSDPENPTGSQLEWAFAWPANRRLLYNRASARPDGQPWSERKKWIWWDGTQWTGFDVPDFPPKKPPDAQADPNGIGLDAHSGSEPFIMKSDGRAWLFAPTGLVDGPIPTYYEPYEAPVHNPLYKQQYNPVLKYWDRPDNKIAQVGDPQFPYIITTYRLTEHHLSGVMTRWNPWLAELQPELFIEMGPELAEEKGIRNLDWVRVTSPRGAIKAKALVTRRLRPFVIDGKTFHHVGMPWHWGYQGVVTGDVVNDLTHMVGDPNVTIHEGKAFMCNVEKA